MAPKFHRKKSKRITTRKREKISKKVSEYKRRERRKKSNPSNPKQSPKDLHVPNSCPFKSEILHEAEKRKRVLDIRAAQKASRDKLQKINRSLDQMFAKAKRGGEEYDEMVKIVDEKGQNSVNHKSYFKELKKVVEASDVILEILDARDPLGSRSKEIEELVITSGKKLVLVINKIDLIPQENLEEWLKFLRQSLPTVAFKASTQLQSSNLSQSKVAATHISESLQGSSRCVGASYLMKVLGNYSRNKGIQTLIKVGVVGFPNVGKSSVINSLKRCRSCSVGATPGLTKTIQEVAIDKHIKILDSPGVVLAKDASNVDLALKNAVKVETLLDVIAPAEAIVKRADLKDLCFQYGVPEFNSCHEFLCMLAKKLGKFKKGGVPNVNEGARKLINDWNRGVIKYYTHPPEVFKTDVCYVKELAKPFDLEDMMEVDEVL